MTQSPISPAKALLVWVAFENYTHDDHELGGCVGAILRAPDDRNALLAAESFDVRLKVEDREQIMGTAK